MLTEVEHQGILSTVILPVYTKGAVVQERPVVVFVAGPPGAGKSAVADLVHEVLARRGGAVRIGSDLYKPLHPAYAALLAADDRRAGVAVRTDTRRWQEGVEAYVRRHRLDAVVETALADADSFRAAAAAYRAAGHRIEVAVLAVPEAVSQLSVLERYLGQVEAAGAGRYVSFGNHDLCSRALLGTLRVIEAEGLADRITVFRRDRGVLASTELNGAARGGEGTVAAVAAERLRPWTARETQCFRQAMSGAQQRVHPARISRERHLAVAQGIERAFALSEPMRRIAQIREEPPGVDYHRLSHDEHHWIFNELIVPGYLGDIVPQEQPVVVYVMGQPGAGKTEAANVVEHALRGRSPVRLSGDDLKAMHPDYHQLLQDSPRGAGAAIRADYRAWMAESEAYVRQRRGDLVIEMAPGSPEDFLRSAIPAAQAGYRVEVVLLGVRAADSRQGTAHRYARALRHGLPGRFTSRHGHDRCFTALTDVARTAERHPAVDSVLVLRRDHTAVYRTERPASGTSAGPGRAAAALATERQRPYTAREAAGFLSVHRELRAALPQYRDELADILAAARRLMPAHLQPPRLPYSIGPVRLPLPAPRAERAADYPVVSRA
ncbi:zeta toxin family protein [Streptomyces monomycini]|uniref:zeta toxin family protein n=1 Tax=Streptomyces monomycini TaxID=371720 RepID=UPI0004AB0A4A|nr:zeta toxin family protein [Streptomyces monomycini]